MADLDTMDPAEMEQDAGIEYPPDLFFFLLTGRLNFRNRLDECGHQDPGLVPGSYGPEASGKDHQRTGS